MYIYAGAEWSCKVQELTFVGGCKSFIALDVYSKVLLVRYCVNYNHFNKSFSSHVLGGKCPIQVLLLQCFEFLPSVWMYMLCAHSKASLR